MKLRTRLLAGATLLVLLPLVGLGLGIRREMAGRLTRADTRRIEALIDVVERELAVSDRRLALSLESLREAFRDDERVRLGLLENNPEHVPWILDWTGRAMTLVGLDLLQVQDADGRIVSSGHFRNEYGRADEETLRGLLDARRGPVLVIARQPEGPFLALARADSLRLGTRAFFLVAGTRIDRGRLRDMSPGSDLVVSLQAGAMALSPDAELEGVLAEGSRPDNRETLVRAREIRTSSGPPARLLVSHSLAERRELLASLDRWLATAWLVTAAGTLLVAWHLSRLVSRPLEELAGRARALDLERLEWQPLPGAAGEVGVLSRVLGEMIARLRAGVARVQEAERRATLGELARQVNHDLRNAFTPIRNVVRHLDLVVRDEPQKLPQVWTERSGTLESSLSYMEELATNWKRLSSRGDRVACDLSDVVREVSLGRPGVVRTELPESPTVVLAEPIGLRRVVENLVANALESLESAPEQDSVRVVVEHVEGAGEHRGVRLRVRDNGRGIPPEDQERVFHDFYTTKSGGNGLGLSIVRRLVSDFEGSVHLESAPGQGTEVTVTFPAREDAP